NRFQRRAIECCDVARATGHAGVGKQIAEGEMRDAIENSHVEPVLQPGSNLITQCTLPVERRFPIKLFCAQSDATHVVEDGSQIDAPPHPRQKLSINGVDADGDVSHSRQRINFSVTEYVREIRSNANGNPAAL